MVSPDFSAAVVGGAFRCADRVWRWTVYGAWDRRFGQLAIPHYVAPLVWADNQRERLAGWLAVTAGAVSAPDLLCLIEKCAS